VFPLNPKSLSLGELYGEFDLSTNEWTDGVLSSVVRNAYYVIKVTDIII
jgi:dynein heavy chain